MATQPLSSSSSALVKRNAETALMPPPPPVKRMKRPATVLEEDEYLNALSHIIKRDFFPGLLESEAQREFLDALESGDKDWIGEAAQRVDVAMTPGRRRTPARKVRLGDNQFGSAAGETPRGWTGDTPSRTPAQTPRADTMPKQPGIDLNMSLSNFQAKYTTEDAESFNALLDKQNLRNREKNAWIWTKTNKLPSKQQLALQQREAQMIAAAGDDKVAGMELAIRRAEEQGSDRPAMPEFKRGEEPRNAFMFIPEGLEERGIVSTSVAQQRENDSKAPPKATAFQNTRLTVPDAVPPSFGSIPASPSLSAIGAALEGRMRATESDVGYSGMETPRVRGYAFVDAEPTAAEMAAAKGESAGSKVDTEAILSRIKASHGGSDETPGQSTFRIPDTSAREAVHHRLVEKVQANNRAPSVTPKAAVADLYAGSTPLPGQTPRFLSALGIKKSTVPLTPAGQRLLRGMQTPRKGGLAGADMLHQRMSSSHEESGFGRFADGAAAMKGERRTMGIAGVTPKRSKS